MKALVTGANGFIGSHLVERLVRAGHEVRAMVLYDARGGEGWLEAIEPCVRTSVEVVAGDVRDADCAEAALTGRDTVLHLAALIGIPYSYRAPASYVDVNVNVNVTSSLNLLNAARLFLEDNGRFADIFLEQDGQIWKAVVKRTGNGAETHLTTLHRAQPRNLVLARRRHKRIK